MDGYSDKGGEGLKSEKTNFKCQNPNVILRQAQDDALTMKQGETMVSLSNHGL